jgi:hypothetical protein
MLVPTFHKCMCSIQFSRIGAVFRCPVGAIPGTTLRTESIPSAPPTFRFGVFAVAVGGLLVMVGRGSSVFFRTIVPGGNRRKKGPIGPVLGYGRSFERDGTMGVQAGGLTFSLLSAGEGPIEF